MGWEVLDYVGGGDVVGPALAREGGEGGRGGEGGGGKGVGKGEGDYEC